MQRDLQLFFKNDHRAASFFRILCFAIFLFNLVWGYYFIHFYPELYENLMLRYVVSLSFFLLFVTSFLSDFVLKNIYRLFLFPSLLAATEIIFLAYMTNFDLHYSMGIVLVLYGVSIGCFTPGLFHFYSISVLIGSLFASLSYQTPNSLTFALSAITSYTCLLFAMSIRFHLLKQIKKNAKLIEQQQKEIIQTEKRAALGRMASGLSHEINTPLSVALGSLELIDKIDPHHQLESYLGKVRGACLRIQNVIQKLNSFTRETTYNMTTQMSVQELVDSSLIFYQSKILNYGIRFECSIQNGDTFIICHPNQIIQVLLNLIDNAIEACTLSKEKWIKVASYNLEGQVVFKISDSGSGINLNHANKIKDPFYTLNENAYKSGMGLSIADSIIQVHKGELFYDVSQSSSTFVVKLPISQIEI